MEENLSNKGIVYTHLPNISVDVEKDTDKKSLSTDLLNQSMVSLSLDHNSLK